MTPRLLSKRDNWLRIKAALCTTPQTESNRWLRRNLCPRLPIDCSITSPKSYGTCSFRLFCRSGDTNVVAMLTTVTPAAIASRSPWCTISCDDPSSSNTRGCDLPCSVITVFASHEISTRSIAPAQIVPANRSGCLIAFTVPIAKSSVFFLPFGKTCRALMVFPKESGVEVKGGSGCASARTRPGTHTPGPSAGGRGCRTPRRTRRCSPWPAPGWCSARRGPTPA
jgi:hypothetical protein